MHMSRGLPLISAEHDPHLPALQFQRQARSGACVARIWCKQSSNTIPSPTSEVYSTSSPLVLSPRQMRKVACGMLRFPFRLFLIPTCGEGPNSKSIVPPRQPKPSTKYLRSQPSVFGGRRHVIFGRPAQNLKRKIVPSGVDQPILGDLGA